MTANFKPTMNPTAEDEVVGDSHAHSKANSKIKSNANDPPVPWSEIFSRHEAFLCSHLDMLSMVKDQIAPEVNGFQTVSSMVNKTVLAMNQLKIARKHIMSKNATLPASSSSSSSNPTQSTDTEANIRKKRRRISRDNDTARPDPTEEERAPKRHRESPSQPITEQEGEFTSTWLGTEDISAEVQRRLKIKEEQRFRKENPKADKRKRDSLVSNDGESQIACKPQKKRLRLENGHKRHGDLVDDADKKKRRKSP
ncbi:uncharacterized protein N7518_002353 [Penicillium psychrosexuale]|uniref:uncharacterized protein n=1 Tax=Penicillium psychrosexuale TaxID=1002107 RepID=UPI002545B0B8|nr:uncharacterized protein N7518_002353 [Penicillium psychrosexuale]KAJ5800285.1 hypothetical protein N7518_002353 [Penicillium psychrosexuale]